MLRDYQLDMYNKIRQELKTHQGVCAVLPCRSGKSYIMKEICEKAALKDSKVLILAHRKLLLRQHAKIIQNCRFESVFTEVNHLGEHGSVDLIIIDEAHISAAKSYQKVCEYYKCKRILFTATARRLDNKPLNLADVIINGISGDELIKKKVISKYELYAPKLDINLKKVRISGNDFNIEDLSEIMLDKKIYGDIVKYYLQLAKDKQAIAYCVDIKHSKTICNLFINNGISAVHMDSSTPEKERDQILQDYKNHKYQILCNCNLISEGITLPECDCCLLLRPTQSETLYIQQACRCLTYRENKIAIIIDYVGNCYAHGMPTEQRIYSLNEHYKIKNPSRDTNTLIIRECKNCFRVYAGNNRICPYCGFDNGKTKKEIEIEQKAELERITELKKKEERMEVGRCRDFQSLVALAKKRNYRNPAYWANVILKSRYNKMKGI